MMSPTTPTVDGVAPPTQTVDVAKLPTPNDPAGPPTRGKEGAPTSSASTCTVPIPEVETTGARTLIVCWHWLPSGGASARVLVSLLSGAPPDRFRVLTRRPVGMDPGEQAIGRAVRVHGVAACRVGKPVRRVLTYGARVTALAGLVAASRRIRAEWDFDRVLAVFPHRYSLLAGHLISRDHGVPLVTYMHDLFIEGLLTHSRFKRRFWRWVDDRALREASLIIVPTPVFADHYRGRGLERIWVLPHTVAKTSVGADLAAGVSAGPVEPRPDAPLNLVYAGKIYDAHDDSVAALARATRDRTDLRMTFLSNAHPALEGHTPRWLSSDRARDVIRQADVCVVALAMRARCPAEIQGCFPSKIVEYAAMGKAMLAVVPAGCFVDTFLREQACAVVCNDLSEKAILAGIDRLRSARLREELSMNARRLADRLRCDRWVGRLIDRMDGLSDCVKGAYPLLLGGRPGAR